MGVTVYSRLGDALRTRNLTVDDLQCQIAARFDLAVSTWTLDRLARDERVRRPNIEIVAVAAVLGVRLDDLLRVDAIPLGDEGAGGTDTFDDEEDDALAPEQSRRLSDLFAPRSRRPLTDDERAEMDTRVGAWGRAVSEREFHELAQRRGVPVEQVRAEVLAETERALAWWKAVVADPVRRKKIMRDVRQRQRARVADHQTGDQERLGE